MGKISLKPIETILDEIEASKNKTTSLSNKTSKKIEILQKRIKKGETTGDYVKDLCILQFGVIYTHYLKEFQENYSKLKKRDGELVLYEELIEQSLKEDRGHYTPAPNEIAVHEIGTIIQPYLQRRVDTYPDFIGITVKNRLYSKQNKVFLEYLEWEKQVGDIIKIDSTTISEKTLANILGVPIPTINFHGNEPYNLTLLSTKLVVGTKEVEKYLKSLGIKKMPVYKSVLKRDKKIALNEQLSLILELSDLSEKGQKLKKEIKKIEPAFKEITYHTEIEQDGSRYQKSSNPELRVEYVNLTNSYDKIKKDINKILPEIKKDILPSNVDLSKVKGMKKEIYVNDFIKFMSSEYKTKKK